MGKCSVCGKLSNNTNVTLHKFPRDEVLCKQWVKEIGREGWMPTDSSFICSDHFCEDRFLVYYNRKRLKPGSVPTILPKKSRCEPPKSNGRNNNDVLATSATIEVPEPIIVVECNHSPTTSNQTLSKDFSSPCTSKTADVRENCQLVTLHDNILHDHRYHNTPRSTMKKFNNMRSRLESTMKENRLLKQQVTRLKKKVHSLQDVIQGLQENRLLPDSAYYCLSANADISLELFNRMIKNQKNMGKLTRDKYPPALRAFALTVHFYSPKAYSYIRETFNLALPHADVLRTWYSCVDAEPGFTEESFASLKEKSDELKEKGQRLLCAVIFDEMGIKKGCQRGRDGTMRGHVDLGVGISGGDDLPEAKHALVIMVVPLDKNWKLPIGYFLITTLNSETKANLLREAFIRLQKAGVTVCSLTLDGPCDHFAAVERLGARMHVDPKKAGHENINNIFKVHFAHPVPGEPDVNVIFDACHMLKNIRNCLGEYLVLFDGEGNKIEWRYVQALALLQQKEGLRLGNRLRTKHIEYRKMVMKVALAAQTLSSSVADSIEFCWNVLKIGEFEGGAATARFLRCADTIFDFLNVRNPLGKHLKCPLKRENEDIWRARLIVELEYLSKIKDKNGTSIFLSRRKAGFIGLFTAVLSTFNIYDLYVKPNESQIKYLLTYKMSQDHLELFFCAVRGRSGWCPNPTVSQFVSAYKRLLVRHDISINTGNVRALDNTRILNVSSEPKKRRARIDRYDVNVYDHVHNLKIREKYGLSEHGQHTGYFPEIHEYLHFTWAQSPNISEFSQQAIGYIAGWVILSLKKHKKINCIECLVACEEIDKSNISVHRQDPTSYIKAITRNFLIIPSPSVVQICLTTESLFRRACNLNSGKPPVEQNFPAVLAAKAFQDIAEYKNIFHELEQHNIEMLSAEEFVSHSNKLIKTIVACYIELRMYAETTKYNLAVTGTNMRHFLTRSIVWAHQ